MYGRAAKQRRRDRPKVQDRIFYVHHCSSCPFLYVDSTWPERKYVIYGCRLIPMAGGVRKTTKENEERQLRIREMFRNDTWVSQTWIPDYCPLRQPGHGAITVMYAESGDHQLIADKVRIEDHYCSMAREEEEARLRVEARKREIEERKQKKEAGQREREEARRRKEAESIERENVRRQKKAEAADRQTARRKEKEESDKKGSPS